MSIKYISLFFGALSVACALGAVYYRYVAVTVRVRKTLQQGVPGVTPEMVATLTRLHRAARLTRIAVDCAIIAVIVLIAFPD